MKSLCHIKSMSYKIFVIQDLCHIKSGIMKCPQDTWGETPSAAVVVLNWEKMPVWFGGLRQVQGRWVGGAQTPCADPVMASVT